MAGLRHTSGPTIAQLNAKLRSAGGSILKGHVGAAVGAVALRELYRGFRGSRDPYGKPWKAVDRMTGRGRRRRAGKPLIRTGHLRQSAAMRPTPYGFEIGMAAEYARYHQYGTRGRARGFVRRLLRRRGRGGIAQRQMIPMKSTGGLGLWGPPMTRAAQAVVKRWGKL